jgi:hypothetical protein
LTLDQPRAAHEVDVSGKHQAAIAERQLSLAGRTTNQAAMASRQLSDHQIALAGVMATAAAANMTQADAAALHAQFKGFIHGAAPAAGAGGA